MTADSSEPAVPQRGAVGFGSAVSGPGAVTIRPEVSDGPTAAGPTDVAATAVTTSGLAKRFHGGQLAVAGIDLIVPHGAVYGFLGDRKSVV